MAPYQVDWFTVADVDVRLNDDLLVEMSTAIEGATIRYTLDGSDPADGGLVYQGRPLYIEEDCTIKAIGQKKDFNDSKVATFPLQWAQFTCPQPTFRLSGMLLYINSTLPDVTIYYTMDGTIPTRDSQQYVLGEPIELTTNCTVTAIVTKAEYRDSAPEPCRVSEFNVSEPEFDVAGTLLTINCPTEGAEIYYGIGEGVEPTTRYVDAIALTDNQVVRAQARKEGYNASPIAEFRHTLITCEAPSLARYDGRYFTLNDVPEGTTVYYTMNGDPADGEAYNARGEVSGTGVLRCVAKHPYKNDSQVTEIPIGYFYDGNGHAEVAGAGQLQQAFAWSGTGAVKTLAVSGPLNDADLDFVKSSFPELQHLDMGGVTLVSRSLPDEAFAGMKSLVSYVSPKDVLTAGERLFADCPQMAAVVWKPSAKLNDNSFGDALNPNLLVYVVNGSFAPSGVRNRVVNGYATNILLTDQEGNNNFYCPEPFTARRISYSHTYTMETEIGTSQGWETIALPFTVQQVSHETKGELMPFKTFEELGSPDTGRPFWLRTFNENRFDDVDVIEAYKPYIISMPNNKEYVAQYNVAGRVTFSAEDVTIGVTEIQPATGTVTSLVPCFIRKEKSNSVWPINKAPETGNAPAGSEFIPELRETKAFEAYGTSDMAYAPGVFSIGNMSGGTTAIYRVLYGGASADDHVRVYDLAGQLVNSGRRADVMKRLPKGVYIVDGRKVVVR